MILITGAESGIGQFLFQHFSKVDNVFATTFYNFGEFSQNFMGAKELKMSLEIFNKMVYFTSIGHLIIIDVQFTRFSG